MSETLVLERDGSYRSMFVFVGISVIEHGSWEATADMLVLKPTRQDVVGYGRVERTTRTGETRSPYRFDGNMLVLVHTPKPQDTAYVALFGEPLSDRTFSSIERQDALDAFPTDAQLQTAIDNEQASLRQQMDLIERGLTRARRPLRSVV